MPVKNKIILFVFCVLILLSVIVTYKRSFADRDFIISKEQQ